jgi:hypothetical protein
MGIATELKKVYKQKNIHLNTTLFANDIKSKEWSFYNRSYSFSGIDQTDVHFFHCSSGGEPGVAFVHRIKLPIRAVLKDITETQKS